MKKFILCAFALAAFGLSNAQETRFGIKAGLNVSNVSGDVENQDPRVGYQFGGFAEIKISKKFAVQPELVYSSLGTKAEEFGTTLTLQLDYITIPLMAKYFVAEKFSIEAGPQIGFLTNAKIKSDGDSADVKDGFEKTDFGINLGAGFDLTQNLTASIRYTAGLSNIVKDSEGDSVQNTNIAIALFYKF